jgi:hypothetical protein
MCLKWKMGGFFLCLYIDPFLYKRDFMCRYWKPPRLCATKYCFETRVLNLESGHNPSRSITRPLSVSISCAANPLARFELFRVQCCKITGQNWWLKNDLSASVTAFLSRCQQLFHFTEKLHAWEAEYTIYGLLSMDECAVDIIQLLSGQVQVE